MKHTAWCLGELGKDSQMLPVAVTGLSDCSQSLSSSLILVLEYPFVSKSAKAPLRSSGVH